jgi:hypothetical protein
MALHRMLQALPEGTSMGILESNTCGPTIVGAMPEDVSTQYLGSVHMLSTGLACQ